jgi:hypothetical protein
MAAHISAQRRIERPEHADVFDATWFDRNATVVLVDRKSVV